MNTHSRRSFLANTAAFGISLGFTPALTAASGPQVKRPADPIAPEVVQEFVRVAHHDADRVKEILAEHPHILNAAWDWGDGDFETAIGAAGHMGLRELALFLLGEGARADLFVLTMLGESAIVKATLERYPHLLRSLGPHGFTLLHHAQKGGEPAADLRDYLREKGLTETHVKVYAK